MEWIKKNPAQVALAAIAILVLAGSYFLWSNISGFSEPFKQANTPWTPAKGIPPVEAKVMDDAALSLAKPAQWTPEKGVSLFVGDRYVLRDNKLESPTGAMFNPPVPNAWLDNYGLDSLNPNILSEDPDKDGFDNLLEYLGLDGKDGTADSTDPTKPDSHPPYSTRLELANTAVGNHGIVSIPFRLRFMSYDVNPRNPKDITAQINTIDRGGRTNFVPVGELIPNTYFKTVAFRKKETPNADGTKKDVSELDIVNTRSNEPLTLILNEVKDSPESYVVLRYLWTPPGGQPSPDMNKKKGEEFTLPPETTKKYKVVDIVAPQQGGVGSVTIQLPDGGKMVLKTDDPELPR